VFYIFNLKRLKVATLCKKIVNIDTNKDICYTYIGGGDMKKRVICAFIVLFILLGVCACDPGMGQYVFKQPKENVVEFAIVDVQDYKTFTKIKDLDLSLLEGFYKEMEIKAYGVYGRADDVLTPPTGEGFLVKYSNGDYVLLMQFNPIEVSYDGSYTLIKGIYSKDWFNSFLSQYKNL